MKYWNSEHDQGIIDFQSGTSVQRDRIYTNLLHPAFLKMAGIIFGRYFLGKDYSLQSHKDDMISTAVITAYSGIGKFDSGSGHKSFSYFQTIIKNSMLEYVRRLTLKRKHYKGWSDVDDQEELLERNFDDPDSNENDGAEYTIIDCIRHIKSIRDKMNEGRRKECIGDLVDIVEGYKTLNKLFITYTLMVEKGYRHQYLRSLFFVCRLSPLLYHSRNFEENFKNIFQKYKVTADRFQDFEYLLKEVFERYERDHKYDQVDEYRKKAKEKARTTKAGVKMA